MKNRILSATVAVLIISCAVTAAQELRLQTKDGMTLQMSEGGAVTALEIGSVKLPLKGTGGFAIADFQKQPEPQNLISNPGFEDGAEGWSLAATQSVDEAIFHSGSKAARIEVPGPEPSSSSLGRTVPVNPDTAYRCELWVRREQVGVCGAYVSERDDSNKLTGKLTQVGRAIPKQDGVWHHLVWELVTQPETTRLNIRSDIYKSTGKLWLDDFFIAEMPGAVYQPIAGTCTKEADGFVLRGGLPESGLQLEATLRADAETIRVDGLVRDTTGNDRAIGVRFGLPVDARGWTWYNELEEREAVATDKPHRHTYDCKSGIGVCSVYPWSALSGPEAGLTLALPISQGPRVFVIQHDQARGLMSLTFYLGLSKDALKNPSQAPFSFVIYRHDPAWGMRSAMEKYYRLFPESFVKRPQAERYLNYANLERYNPETHQLDAYRGTQLDDASDFGEGYKFLWHLHGCYDFRMVPYDHPERPSDETVMALLNEMVEKEKEKAKGYTPTAETIKKLTYGPNGEILYIGDTRYWRPQEGYNRTDKPGWGLNFRVNEDPGVSTTATETSRAKLEQYAQDDTRRPFDACFTADAIEGYFANRSGLNYRREHFATTDVPLTFGKETLGVAMPNTIWDFHNKSWWPLTQKYQVATYGNANLYEQTFTMPFVDVPMVENEWDRGHPERFERYLRAIAHHKIWRFWRVLGDGEKHEPSVRRHFARGLAYAVYPCVGALNATGGNIEKYRHLFRQYVPAIEELSIAGWEPVPYARATEDVIVERYGSFTEGELHFTFRNYDTEAARATALTIDRQALGIPADAALVAVDILPGIAAATAVSADAWEVTIAADNARAFWVGTRDQMAQHGLRLAARTLGKIERFFELDLTEENRAQLRAAQALARSDAPRTGKEALGTADELVSDIAAAIETRAPVDLAKLLYRLRTDLSYVPAGVLHVDVTGPRVVETALRGETVKVAWDLELRQSIPITVADANMCSPWDEVAQKCSVTIAPTEPPRRMALSLKGELFVPADPPRLLMPYLLQVNFGAGDGAFSIAVPVDVKVADPLSVRLLPQRVFRGQETKVSVEVTNRLQQAGKVQLKFSPPAKMEMQPAEFDLDLGAEAVVSSPVAIKLAGNARLGEVYMPYQVSSDDARFAMAGKILLKVTEPVASAAINRLDTAPEIDGDLSEAAWKGEPTIAELPLLRGGKPASEKTAVWVAYDRAGLYVAMRCQDAQMHKLKAELTDRGDPLYREDDVEVFLLLPGQVKTYQFAVNALGTISDNFGNKAPWTAKAKRFEDAWTVEVFIPYGAVGAGGPPEPGHSWAAQFGRQQKAKGETSAWVPGPGFNRPDEFGEIVFR